MPISKPLKNRWSHFLMKQFNRIPLDGSKSIDVSKSETFRSFVVFGKSTLLDWSRGSSVSIVSDYGLDKRAIEIRSPAEAKGFFL
jgi:hypothetical protein